MNKPNLVIIDDNLLNLDYLEWIKEETWKGKTFSRLRFTNFELIIHRPLKSIIEEIKDNCL